MTAELSGCRKDTKEWFLALVDPLLDEPHLWQLDTKQPINVGFYKGHGVDLAIPWMKMVPENFASKCGHCPRKVARALLDYYTDRRVIGIRPTTIFDLELGNDGQWQATTFHWNCEVAQIPSEGWNNKQNPLVTCAPGDEDRRVRDNLPNQQSKTFEPFGFKLTTKQTAGTGRRYRRKKDVDVFRFYIIDSDMIPKPKGDEEEKEQVEQSPLLRLPEMVLALIVSFVDPESLFDSLMLTTSRIIPKIEHLVPWTTLLLDSTLDCYRRSKLASADSLRTLICEPPNRTEAGELRMYEWRRLIAGKNLEKIVIRGNPRFFLHQNTELSKKLKFVQLRWDNEDEPDWVQVMTDVAFPPSVETVALSRYRSFSIRDIPWPGFKLDLVFGNLTSLELDPMPLHEEFWDELPPSFMDRIVNLSLHPVYLHKMEGPHVLARFRNLKGLKFNCGHVSYFYDHLHHVKLPSLVTFISPFMNLAGDDGFARWTPWGTIHRAFPNLKHMEFYHHGRAIDEEGVALLKSLDYFWAIDCAEWMVGTLKELGTSVHHAHFTGGLKSITENAGHIASLKSEIQKLGRNVETMGTYGLRFTKEARFTRDYFVGKFPFQAAIYTDADLEREWVG